MPEEKELTQEEVLQKKLDAVRRVRAIFWGKEQGDLKEALQEMYKADKLRWSKRNA